MAEFKNVSGFKEFAAALKQLPQNVGRKHLRGSVAKGATIIRNEARVLAPQDTGEMAKDIQVKRERTAGSHIARYSVYVRVGKKSRLAGRKRNVDRDSFYWIFQELGTAKAPAQPFMRPAYESKKEAAVDAIGVELGERIQKEATELGRR